jgi:hypothetical protein
MYLKLDPNPNQAMKIELFLKLAVFSISIAGCQLNFSHKTTYENSSDGFRIITHEKGDTNLVEEYYLDSSLRSLGIEIHNKREGRWIEFYPNGDTIWDGYYSEGNRVYPSDFYIESSEVELIWYLNPRYIWAPRDTLKFNLRNKNVHPDEIVFYSIYNCKIQHMDPQFNDGFTFRMIVGERQDSIAFFAEAKVFQYLPIKHFYIKFRNGI